MPVDEEVLGFSNKWYPRATENRQDAVLELLNSAQDVRVYLAAKASELMSNADFLNILPGILNSSESAGFVENTLRTIANSSAG